MASPLDEYPTVDPSVVTRDRLTVDECFHMLAKCQLGRLGAIVNGRPVIVPAAYVSVRNVLVVRVDSCAVDDAMHRVAFEVEATDARSRTGWSVVVQGAAIEITDEIELRELELLGPPLPEGRPTRWLRIRPGHIIGRRLPDLGVKEDSAAA